MGKKDEHQPEEQVEAEAAVLPAREAMSLITPDPNAYIADLNLPSTDGAASASEHESATSEDRSERFENRDSASSQT